jgi:HEAT repeat protein
MNTIPEIISALTSSDGSQRAAALEAASKLGAPGIEAISPLLAHSETEHRRAAQRALAGIVRQAGATGKLGQPAAAAERALLASLARHSDEQARRDIIWFLSEVGQADTVKALADLLNDAGLREDARCALERIPGTASIKALKAGFDRAPDEFKFALAESLRKRGETVSGYPSQRLVPTRDTEVQPVA